MELLALNNDNPNPRELKESFKDLKIIRCSDSRYDHMFLFLPHSKYIHIVDTIEHIGWIVKDHYKILLLSIIY